LLNVRCYKTRKDWDRRKGLHPGGPSARSIVKVAPHFGHFNGCSVLTIPAQPKENAARTNNAKTMLIHFFTPLHLLSSGGFLKYHSTFTGILSIQEERRNWSAKRQHYFYIEATLCKKNKPM
jgi:hypothetical protein